MCDLPHSDALSGHTIVRADGARRATAAQELGVVRHRARRVPAEADDPSAIGRWLRMVLPTVILTSIDLAAASARLAKCAAIPGNVVPLPAIQPGLASLDQASPYTLRDAI